MVTDDAWKLENDFGKRVRLLRKIRGLTQRKLIAFEIKQAYLAAVEAGSVRTPSPGMIEKFARAFEVTVEELVRGTDLDRTIKKRRKAYCPSNDCPKLSLNRFNTGMIIPFRFSIELVQTDGERTFHSKYCPYCGTALVSECPSCHEPILVDDPLQTHCLHCGKELFSRITEQMMQEKGFR